MASFEINRHGQHLATCSFYKRVAKLANKGKTTKLCDRTFKYWFSVTQSEQKNRFASRETDPLKRWKLSPIDRASLDKWDDYTEAKEAMFFYTDTADAPWTIIRSNDKKRARLNCMRHFLASLDYPDKDTAVVQSPDPKIVGQANHVVENYDHIFASSLHPETARG